MRNKRVWPLRQNGDDAQLAKTRARIRQYTTRQPGAIPGNARAPALDNNNNDARIPKYRDARARDYNMDICCRDGQTYVRATMDERVGGGVGAHSRTLLMSIRKTARLVHSQRQRGWICPIRTSAKMQILPAHMELSCVVPCAVCVCACVWTTRPSGVRVHFVTIAGCYGVSVCDVCAKAKVSRQNRSLTEIRAVFASLVDGWHRHTVYYCLLILGRYRDGG